MSRFRSIAAAVSVVLVAVSCTSSATPAPPTAAPATQAPATAAPATQAPATAAPATAAPATAAPATQAPASEAPASEAPASEAPASEAPASEQPSQAAPASPLPFAGVNVNLLTFNGPQVAEPLQRRAPDFEKLTGAHINVDAVAFQTIYNQALADAAAGVNSFDAYVFDPQWMGDFVTPGYLLDLSDRVKADSALQWDDIGPFFRDFNASYNGKTYTIPLDGDFHMVYYRKDLLERDNLQPPATWDDYLTIAQKYQGQDLNEDGTPDYGSCISMKKGAQAYWWIISIAAGLIQSQGTGQGVFFDTDNMNPLFGNNEAMTKALQMLKSLSPKGDIPIGDPTQLNQDVGATRGLFTTGRCALSMDWGDIGTLATGTYVADKFGATVTPGWKEVLDRKSGKLVPCDATLCPNMVDGVNKAPFASFGGWSGAIATHSVNPPKDDAGKAVLKKVQDAAYAFLSYMSQPAQANVDVTLGKTGYNPYRTSQFDSPDLWLQAGLTEGAATSYLGAIGDSLNSPNMVLDLRIPQTAAYQQGNGLDAEVAAYLAGEQDEAQTGDNITTKWNEITDAAGKDSQLAAYIASLGVQR